MKNLKLLITVAVVLTQASFAVANEQDDVQKSLQDRLQTPEMLAKSKARMTELVQQKKDAEIAYADANNFVKTVDEFRSESKTTHGWLDFKGWMDSTNQAYGEAFQKRSEFAMIGGGVVASAGYMRKKSKWILLGTGIIMGGLLMYTSPAMVNRFLKNEAENIHYIETTDAATTTQRYETLKNSTIPALNKSIEDTDTEIKTLQETIRSLR